MLKTYSTVLRHKIWFDIWGAKQRTLQAIFTIAIGAFAMGAIFGGWEGILRDVNAGWSRSNPWTIHVRVIPGAPEELVEALARIPGISAVEGEMEATIQWRPTPDSPWAAATLVARDDYAKMHLNVLRLEEGTWPRGQTLGVERSFGVAPGDQVELRLDPAGATRDVGAPVGGILYHAAALSPYMGGDIRFYATRQRFAELTGVDAFHKIMVAIPDYDQARAVAVAQTLDDRLVDQQYGIEPGGFRNEDKVSNPQKAPVADTVAGIGFVMQSIGVISAVLGLLLIFNTVTAIIAQQTAQIGELKAVGASTNQILVVYFSVVFAYGLAAALIAVPLGILAANGLRVRLVSMLGSDTGPFLVASGPILMQLAFCLVAPLVIAALPISQGARITVREAMSSYGLNSGGSKLDEMLSALVWLPRAMSLAVSNAFRNKSRVLLTQAALVGAGVTFMAVMSTRASLVYTFDDLYFQLYPYPIQFTLLRTASDRQILQVEDLAEVTQAEVWRQMNAYVRAVDRPEAVTDVHPQLVGVPVPTAGYEPLMLAGRWLHPEDDYAVVLHDQLAHDVGVTVGEWVVISIPDGSRQARWRSQREWQVVGLVLDPSSANLMMVPRTTLAAEVGGAGSGNRVQLNTHAQDPAETARVAVDLRSFYAGRGIDLAASDADTVAQRSAKFLRNVNTISMLLIVMAVMVAAVGGIALSGVLSIGVLERRREIGVLRAIGSTPRTILSQFVAEGLMMGWLSWAIALTLSYPAGVGLVNLLGNALQLSFVYRYSVPGVAGWLVLATIIGVMASWSPAQAALKMSVQESLAYE